MIPTAFDYQKANTVDEALAALTADSKLLAGGHSLLPAIKLRLNQPGKLIDISTIAALKGIKEEDGEIVIGAATTHAEIAVDNLMKDKLSFFAEGASMIGDVQVRNCGTIGGSLAHADPSADWTALVLAADAAIEVQSSSGKRRIIAADFFTGLFSTALNDGEIITAIRVPVPAAGTKTAYQKFSQPASRFAIVGCAVMKKPDGKIRIAFTGVTDTPFAASSVDEAHAAIEAANVLSDHFASAEYRKHLAKVYLKKGLEAAE